MSGLSLARARQGWGKDMPDWVHALATECDKASQSKAAKELKLSTSTISQVLGNCYGADLSTIEQTVRGRFLKETVICPVLGDLSKDHCLNTQRRIHKSEDDKHGGLLATNPTWVHLARTCPSCRHHAKNLKGETDAE